MRLVSDAFAHGTGIPVVHTCDGLDQSPPLAWADPPAGTVSFALIMDDPDAVPTTWVHWLIYDLPARTLHLPPDVPRTQYLPGAARQGLNDSRCLGYGGPCPPIGKPHRYLLRLFALDRLLDLPPGIGRARLEAAIQGRVLDTAELLGTYGRTPR
jgi:hypothetical protein